MWPCRPLVASAGEITTAAVLYESSFDGASIKTGGGINANFAQAQRLHQARFADKELRLGFFSKHGFEPALRAYLGERGVWTAAEA